MQPKFTLEQEIVFRKQLPRKVVSACILLFNEQQELLILKPNYRPHWLLVGGIIDARESPINGLRREIKEEIGLEVEIKHCVIVDSLVITKGENYQDDHLEFVFLGATLTNEQIQQITLEEHEIDDYQFLPFQKALNYVSANMRQKLEQLNGNFEQTLFLKQGQLDG